MKKFLSFILAAAIICSFPLAFSSCKSDNAIDKKAAYTTRTEPTSEITNFIQIEIEGGTYIVAELYPDVAPKTVENIKKLVSEKFYDGITFHRVISGFMIQCGDPTGTGMSGSDEEIFGEFDANGFKNSLSHTRGVLSMARRGNDNNSASSQFFIVHNDSPYLDGQYAAFGKVIRGIETVDAIASVETGANDKPVQDVVIKTISFVEK